MQIRPVVIYAEMLKIRPVYILLFLTYGLWAFTGLLWRLLCGKFGKTTVSCCDFFVVSDKICNFALTTGDSRSLFNTYALSRLCRGYSFYPTNTAFLPCAKITPPHFYAPINQWFTLACKCCVQIPAYNIFVPRHIPGRQSDRECTVVHATCHQAPFFCKRA